jgi:nuclear pore complex protein Nup205
LISNFRITLIEKVIDNPEALERHYDLMLSVMRVINAAVISKGEQNEQTVTEGRSFLVNNRPTIVSILKRSAKVGGYRNSTGADLEDLVESFVLLMSLTDYLEVSSSSLDFLTTIV